MRLEDYEKKVFEDFLGLYRKGEIDQVPENYFSDCLNIDCAKGEWKTRSGLSTSIFLKYNGNVRRFASFSDSSGPIILILDDFGNLYTYSNRPDDEAATPRLTVADATDFSAIKMYNKIFIAFHDGQIGSSSVNLKVFIPGAGPTTDEFRDAGGLAPTAATTMIAADGVAGLVNAGTYKIAVSYITSSGFVTPPGPRVPITGFTATIYVASGSKKINLSNIPIGPAGTTQRQILITKADLLEYFFLPSIYGGLIDNNTATTTTLDFDDTTDLVDSADYLLDLLETIPSALCLVDYNNKLCLGGCPDNPSVIKVSLPGEPETFDSIDGLVNISKDDGFTIHNMIVMRRSLYAWKNLGVHATLDDGGIPVEWNVDPVDPTVSVSIHGIAEFFDIANIRISRDWTLVADKSGIVLFDGVVRKPPITHYISDIWESIDFNNYHKIVLVVDEQLHKVYCTIPTFPSSENNILLVGNYDSCPGNIPSADSIRWSLWDFNICGSNIRPTEIGMFGFPPDVVPTLKIGSIDGEEGKIWTLDPNALTDDGNDIESFFETSLMFWEQGNIHLFSAARLRVIGSGIILCSIEGEIENGILSANLPSIPLIQLDYRFELADLSIFVNGSETIFPTCYSNIGTFFAVFQNGLLIKSGTDYTGSFSFIDMAAPPVGDTIQVLYRRGIFLTDFKLETPNGTIDGVNATFNLSSVPADSGVAGWQNGLLIKSGTDFTRVGSVITMVNPPLINDTLQFLFHINNAETGFTLETPLGNITGSNRTFTASNKLKDNFAAIFQNGLLLRNGVHYRIIGKYIIFVNAPQVNDTIQILYRIDTSTNNIGEKLIRFNFQNERARILFKMTSGRFIVSKLELFGKPIYQMRPA